MKTIYLDNAATTPMHPLVIEEMQKHLSDFGNPSSAYQIGINSSELIEKARYQVANVIHASPDEIYFTSGGTESDNWAIISGYDSCNWGNHIVTTQVEHHAILNSCRYLEKYRDADVSYLGVDRDGNLDSNALCRVITDRTILVSVMKANNEIGNINNIYHMAQTVKNINPRILFHTDAV